MRNEPTMEFIDQYLIESAPNTATMAVIAVPTSRSELLGMLIHDVWFHIPAVDRIADSDVRTMLALHKHSFAVAMPRFFEDTIAAFQEEVWIGSADGVLYHKYQWQKHWHFSPPILIARDTLTFTIASEEMVEANYGNVRIGYTLEKVAERVYIAALVR